MYRKNNSGWMKHWDFELLDIILLEFTFFLSYILRHSDSWYEKPGMYVRLGVLMLVVDIVVIFFSESYKHILERRKGKEFFAVIQHVTTVYLVLLLYEFIIKATEDRVMPSRSASASWEIMGSSSIRRRICSSRWVIDINS